METQKKTQEVLLEERTELANNNEFAEIDLGFDLSKTKQAFSNIFSLASLALKDSLKKKNDPPTQQKTAVQVEPDTTDEENSKTSEDEENAETSEEHITTTLEEPKEEEDLKTSENSSTFAKIEVGLFSSSSTKEEEEDNSTKEEGSSVNYNIDITESPGVKKFIKLTSTISLLQFAPIFFFFILDSFGIHYRHSIVSSDVEWLFTMMFFSLLTLKANNILRKSKIIAYGFFLIDTLITGRGYIFAFYSASYLTFIMLASISISLATSLLSRTTKLLSEKKAFKFTFVLFAIFSTVVVFIFGWEFRHFSFIETLITICGIGYIAGQVAKERVKILGKRLEQEERSIQFGECFAIGCGANVRGLMRVVRRSLSIF